MKRDTLYTILIILLMGLFLTNFIIFRMKNNLLTNMIILTIILGSVFILKDYFKRKEENKLNQTKKQQTINTLYKILLVLIIGFFTINLILCITTKNILLSGISLGFMIGGVLLLKYNLQRKIID